MKKLIIKFLLISITAVIIITAAVNIYMIHYSEKYIYDVKEAENKFENRTFECAIILGASIKADGTPSDILRLRLDRGIDLYNKGLVRKLLLTGDNGQVEYNEVLAMKNYVISKGIAPRDVFLDHAGFSTYESMYRAKEVFNVDDALVITQKFHETRSIYIGRKLGLNVYGVYSDDIDRKYNKRDIVREFFARGKDYIKTIVRPDPTYLGNKIDIRGSGEPSW